jgi:hypothetical protein
MGIHEHRLNVPESRSGKSDRRVWLVERDAKVRAGLADTILGSRCLNACQRLFDYSVDLRDDPVPHVQGLREASEEVILWTQRELAALLSDEPLPPAVAFQLHTWQWLARRAHLEQHGRQCDVKTYEVAVTDGAPLAICMGTNISLDVSSYRRVAASRGKTNVVTAAFGCFRVFPDTTQTSRRMWRPWCDRCTPNTGQKRRAWKAEMRRRARIWESAIRARERARLVAHPD